MRAFILVMDSFGIGAAPDADSFGDIGSHTYGHIKEQCAKGNANIANIREGSLTIPNLLRLGLDKAANFSPADITEDITGAFGRCSEQSSGKDTPSGHWEMTGLPVTFDWAVFPKTVPSFPTDLIKDLVQICNLPGILGNCHASGTEIISRLGEEHIRTGKPICYTSSDSVFQIAAHESVFGLEHLYDVCVKAQALTLPLNIGRVIARPFIGGDGEPFTRTPHRRDYTTNPHGPTLLNHVIDSGGEVISIGKIADIFANQGISRKLKAPDNMGLFDCLLNEVKNAADGSLTFVNFVDFDMLFGHRRDVAGYATALEEFDNRLPEFEALLGDGDLALITADHGCDPTWTGTDHTREFVPSLFFGPNVKPQNLGDRDSFADMGQTIASHLNLKPLAFGKACF